MGQLDGKVAIVTGSGRGIGQQVALRLARDGAAARRAPSRWPGAR
jgi:3-oxoacyl-[acyl-carrier protein] reductase